jgi:hypothetical protein
MGARSKHGKGSGRSNHNLAGNGDPIEPAFQQKPLVILPARPPPSLDDNAVALLLQLAHAVHGEDHRLFVEKQRVVLDGSTDPPTSAPGKNST